VTEAAVAVVDRGDTLPPAVAEAAVAEEKLVLTSEELEVTPLKSDEAQAAGELKVEEPERDEKGRFIPASRHKEVLENERTKREGVERQLAELQATIKKVDINADVAKLEEEVVAMELAREAALLDGDKEKAASLSRDIRFKERHINEIGTSHKTAQAEAGAVEKVRFDMAVERLEDIYPALKEGDEAFDQEKVDDVLGWQGVYMQRDRLSPSAALVKAAEKVMGTAKAEEPPKTGLAAGKDTAADRKAAAVAKNLDAAAKQPASMKEVGIDSDKVGIQGKVDVSRLSEEEFAALPAATKAKLRGDTL
jgi:hypothetical protein